MIYTDIVEYNMNEDTKAPLLRGFLFLAKLKSGDILTTGQFMNYQTFSIPQFRRLLKNSFHSIHIEFWWEDSRCLSGNNSTSSHV